MAHYDQSSGTCHVYTFKEGLLSAIAHDLKIDVGRWRVDVDDATRAVEATFDPASLAVICAMKSGHDAPGTISERDRKKIADNIRKDVLNTRKHSEIRFRSTSTEPAGQGFVVGGQLTIAGRTRSLQVAVRRVGDRLETHVQINQPDYGIKPYSAMLGTLKIQPQVEVRLSVPAPG